MAKIRCLCDEAIPTSQGPCPHAFLFLHEPRFVARFRGVLSVENVYDACEQAFLCPRCKRLHVFARGMGQAPWIYRPDTPSDWVLPTPEPDTPPGSWEEMFGAAPSVLPGASAPAAVGIGCRCGEWIDASQIEAHWRGLSDVDFDEWVGDVDAAALLAAMHRGALCPRCKRLHMDVARVTSGPRPIYRPEATADWPDAGPAGDGAWTAFYGEHP